jgi:hypothetical protein
MGQDGLPISVAIFFSAVILAAAFLIGLIIVAVLLA